MMLVFPAAAHERGEPIEAGENAVFHRSFFDVMRPTGDARDAEAAFHDRAFGGAEGGHAAIGPGEHFGAVVGGEHDDGIVGFADIVEMLEERADAIIELGHAGFFQAVVRFAVHLGLVFRREERPHVHAGGVVPNEERLAVLLGFIHEVARAFNKHFVESGHIVLGLLRNVVHVRHVGHVGERRQRAFVDNLLLANLAPPRLHGWIIRIAGVAMDQIARAKFVAVRLIVGERVPIRIGHGVEVVQVAKEFVEAVHRGQELVQIAEMVFAELAGGITLRFECRGQRAGLCWDADIGAGLADSR